MHLLNTVQSIDLSLIDVSAKLRQRQSGRGADGRLTGVESLQGSIARNGLLQPVIVEVKPDGRFELRVGERRFTACQNLGHQKILARKVTDLPPIEAQIMEQTENIHREDLEWQEAVRGVAAIHRLYVELSTAEDDGSWSQEDTARECNITQGLVSMYLAVEAQLGEDRIAKASGVREAFNMLRRRDQRKAGEALQELLDTPDVVLPAPSALNLTQEQTEQVKILTELGKPLPPEIEEKRRQMWRAEEQKRQATAAAPLPESIVQASFLDWAPTYSGPKFNLIHCDFPYGVELFSGPQGRGSEAGTAGGLVGYEDSVKTYWSLLDGLCEHFDRFASYNCHLMFWLSADHTIMDTTRRVFAAKVPTLSFYKFQLIWLKSDNAGISSDASHTPRHVYEACLLASRGERNLVRVKADAYSAPTDKKLHPSTKPEPMLRHFMEMLVDETTSLLDPTCGSGAALRAAESLGAPKVLGLELDRQFIDPARLALKQARAKRLAERTGSLGAMGL